MSSITIRNISEEMSAKIKALAQKERRSINNQILNLLDEILAQKVVDVPKTVSIEQRNLLWKGFLEDPWEDHRSLQEQLNEIYQSRTVSQGNYDFD